MIGLLTHGLAARARELAKWETGYEPTMSEPRLISEPGTPGTVFPSTTEFRLEVPGPMPTTYVVTIAEVRTL